MLSQITPVIRCESSFLFDSAQKKQLMWRIPLKTNRRLSFGGVAGTPPSADSETFPSGDPSRKGTAPALPAARLTPSA